MLIVAVGLATVGYTLMWAGVKVPIDQNGQPDFRFVYNPFLLWSYAAQQVTRQFNPQLAGKATLPAPTSPPALNIEVG